MELVSSAESVSANCRADPIASSGKIQFIIEGGYWRWQFVKNDESLQVAMLGRDILPHSMRYAKI